MTANSDIYERHRQAVKEWRDACEEVERVEQLRELARSGLDKISQELLAACADGKPAKPVIRRGRRPKSDKMNGIDVKALMRQPNVSNVLD